MLKCLDTYKRYIKEIWLLSLPIIMGNVGHMFVGAGDVFVAARHGVQTLAAIGIGNAFMTCVVMLGIGLLSGVSPVLSNLKGSGVDAKKFFIPTILYSQIISLIFVIIVLLALPIVDIVGFEPSLKDNIKSYIFLATFSNFGGFLHFALKEYLQAHERVFFANFLAIIAIFVNLFFNFVLVFGLLGFPELGVIGLAVATIIVRTFLGLTLLIYCLKDKYPKQSFEVHFYKDLVRVSAPIALSCFVEFFAFNLITIFMGRVNSVFAAAQNILLLLSSLTFMIPLAISNSIAVKVGFFNGANNPLDIRRYSIVGSSIAVLCMFCCAICYLTFPAQIIGIFTSNAELIKICVPLLMIVGVFQIFDGFQVSFGGILKGLKSTKIVLISTFVAHWLLGLPIGFLLAFKFHLNLLGFWTGLSIALIFLSMILFVFVRKKISKRIISA